MLSHPSHRVLRQLSLGSINLPTYDDAMSTLTSKFPTVGDLGPNAGTAIAHQFEMICRLLLRGPAVTSTREFLRYLTHEPHPFGNFAVVSDPTNRDHTAQAIEPLGLLNLPTAIVYPGSPSKDVESFVHKAGYVLAESMPAMAVNIDALAAAALPSGYQCRQINSLNDDSNWCEAFAARYGIPRRVADDFGPRAAGESFASGTLRYFAITKGNTIVATSTMHLDGKTAGIYCVATLPEHRGKGLGAFATAEPLRQARTLGYQTGILQSSAMGEPVYRRLGFEQLGVMPLYVRMPAGMSAGH
jgi:GNAT superfamily N-acetyltransferase